VVSVVTIFTVLRESLVIGGAQLPIKQEQALVSSAGGQIDVGAR